MSEYGKNITAEAIHVLHSSLKAYGSGESAYRKVCPVCKEGALMVQRDQETFDLINIDRCVKCAQPIIYDDGTINGEKVHPRNLKLA